MIRLKRVNLIDTIYVGHVSMFQLDVKDRYNKDFIKSISSIDGRDLKFNHTHLSGYITICEDIKEIIVLKY